MFEAAMFEAAALVAAPNAAELLELAAPVVTLALTPDGLPSLVEQAAENGNALSSESKCARETVV